MGASVDAPGSILKFNTDGFYVDFRTHIMNLFPDIVFAFRLKTLNHVYMKNLCYYYPAVACHGMFYSSNCSNLPSYRFGTIKCKHCSASISDRPQFTQEGQEILNLKIASCYFKPRLGLNIYAKILKYCGVSYPFTASTSFFDLHRSQQ